MSLEVFHHETWSVRTLLIDDEPWFVGRDVCDALGYGNARQAISTHVNEADRGVQTLDTPGGAQPTAIVNESGLYALIFGSRLDTAKAFRRWVTSEVLPSIRRTGRYAVSQFEIPTTLAGALQLAADQARELEAAQAALAEAAPKVAFVDQLVSAEGDYSLREAAQILDRDPSISTGQNRLLGTLIEFGWVDRRGKLPYQAAICAGRLAVRTTTYDHPTEGPKVTTQVRVTPKGLAEIHRRLGGTARLALRAATR
jgi:prophage antirepressor-like protein